MLRKLFFWRRKKKAIDQLALVTALAAVFEPELRGLAARLAERTTEERMIRLLAGMLSGMLESMMKDPIKRVIVEKLDDLFDYYLAEKNFSRSS